MMRSIFSRMARLSERDAHARHRSGPHPTALLRRMLLCAALLLASAGVLSAQSSASYAIAFDVFDSGGGMSSASGAAVNAHSIIGQAAVLHVASAASHTASSGAGCMFCGSFVTSAVDPAMLPDVMRLYQNYPNPFNPSTTIRYSLERGGHVRLSVYNLLGEKVDVIVDEHRQPGDYSIEYNAAELQSGVYLYRLRTGDGQLTLRMMLMK